MDCFSLDFEATPVDPDGYDGAYLLRRKSCDDYVGTIGRIFGLDFDVKGGFCADVDFGDKFRRSILLLLILQKPTKQTHLIFISQIISILKYGQNITDGGEEGRTFGPWSRWQGTLKLLILFI